MVNVSSRCDPFFALAVQAQVEVAPERLFSDNLPSAIVTATGCSATPTIVLLFS
jgi:hypothetical protein